MENVLFNPSASTIIHLDINSCFATIEQQANPFLRGKPIAVAAYPTPNGCILAPSIEAKKYGVKTGMLVRDGKLLCPSLLIISSDPWKYRNVHLSLKNLISDYTPKFNPKSIDEFVLHMEGTPVIRNMSMQNIAKEIKLRIKQEVGDWIKVSVGISTNRFLAKTAAGLHKPDGLDEINKDNFLKVYSEMALTDICGIKEKNAARLSSFGINTVSDFYYSPIWKLKAAFHSIVGYYWFTRLRGFEIDDVEFGRRSYGNSYSLPKPLIPPEELSPILTKLVEKTGFRLRKAGLKCQGVHLAVGFRDGSFWHKGVKTEKILFDSRDIFKIAYRLLLLSPRKPARDLAVSVFNLIKSKSTQLELFENVLERENMTRSIDQVNNKWGSFVITPARMFSARGAVPDRIAFGGVKELEEFSLNGEN